MCWFQIGQSFVLPRFLHTVKMLLYSCGSDFWKQRHRVCSKASIRKLFLLINGHIAVIPIRLRFERTCFGFQIPGLNNFLPRIQIWFKFAQLELFLYPFESPQISTICEHFMKSVELVVTIRLITIQAHLCRTNYQFSISFGYRSDYTEKCKLLPLFWAQEFAVEFYKFEEDAFEQHFSLLGTPFQIQEGNKGIKYESSGSKVITKVDEFKDAPSINNGRRCPTDSQKSFMQICPLFERVVPFLVLILVFQYHQFQLVLFHTLNATFVLIFIYSCHQLYYKSNLKCKHYLKLLQQQLD